MLAPHLHLVPRLRTRGIVLPLPIYACTEWALTNIHTFTFTYCVILYSSVSQPPGRGPVPDPGINYTGPREVLLEFVILVF
jgi:hypothetical protein